MEAKTAGVPREAMPVLMPERMKLAESARRDWVADVEIGRTVEDILHPSYWAHIGPQLSPGDHIEARAEDGQWVAYLYVFYAERTFAYVVLDRLLKIKANEITPQESIKHKVEWKGPHHKFGVVRVADSKMLQADFKTRDEAVTWLRNHERAS